MNWDDFKISLSNIQREEFDRLFALFSEWNAKMNLSAIRNRTEVFEKHFADSLLPTKFIDFGKKKILDLGSGGGFPVLPLAIMVPDSRFFAIDSVGKKMMAVQDMAEKLKLPVYTIHGRIEVFGQDKKFREQFDIVMARALAPWPVLLEYAIPFVKLGGFFLAYQGPGILEDLKHFQNLEKKLGGTIEKVFKEKLGEYERVFVVVRKTKETPKIFPRRKLIVMNKE